MTMLRSVLACGGGHGGVRRGQRAEVAGEPLLAVVIDADTAEDQRLVLAERGADRGHRVRVQLKGGADAGDLGADPRGNLAEAKLRTDRCRGHGLKILNRSVI